MRIGDASMYWPLSDRVAQRLYDLAITRNRGEIMDPQSYSFESLEGTDLATVWEPIMQDHPAARKGDWINWIHEDTAESNKE